jgi:hypothetical protein
MLMLSTSPLSCGGCLLVTYIVEAVRHVTAAAAAAAGNEGSNSAEVSFSVT